MDFFHKSSFEKKKEISTVSSDSFLLNRQQAITWTMLIQFTDTYMFLLT